MNRLHLFSLETQEAILRGRIESLKDELDVSLHSPGKYGAAPHILAVVAELMRTARRRALVIDQMLPGRSPAAAALGDQLNLF